jgi:ferredoxin
MGADLFEIKAEACTECVGFHGQPQCAAVCPVDSCVTDPAHVETEAALIAKVKVIHPTKDFSGNVPSHFKK